MGVGATIFLIFPYIEVVGIFPFNTGSTAATSVEELGHFLRDNDHIGYFLCAERPDQLMPSQGELSVHPTVYFFEEFFAKD
jgi:hypothetical protein